MHEKWNLVKQRCHEGCLRAILYTSWCVLDAEHGFSDRREDVNKV